ncbi:MAG: division/cell wall cluster transcriptional repressor MraZ [Treponema sp.]|jgi:MraZ protein|nr:division/cell wall cluster transcriptional repressor MraZ [Treponema sp.]
MALLSGEYQATLDDKGRISIPARFREGVPDNVLVLTRGLIEHCVWAMTMENWEEFSAQFKGRLSIPLQMADMVHHRMLHSTYEVELDKAGRIAVPQKLRDFAGLSKDCVVTSDGFRIEIWDAARHADYERRIEEQFPMVLNEMGTDMRLLIDKGVQPGKGGL